MSTNIKENIKVKMEEKNWNVSTLERNAGIKIGTLRNIFQGKSNNPSAETLVAIANSLECTVDELLGRGINSDHKPTNQSISFTFDSNTADKEWNINLFNEASKIIQQILSKKNKSIKGEQAFSLIKEIYYYSVKKEKNNVDYDFAEWLIDKII